MQSSLLKRLDEIERLSPDPFTGQELEALDLMREFAKGREELCALIERYGRSTTPIIAQSLSCLFTWKPLEPNYGLCDLVLVLIAKFRCWNQGEAVMNCLTVLHNWLHYCCVDKPLSEASRSLFPFLSSCLDYDLRLSVIIKGDALSLLSIITSRSLLDQLFTADEILWLRKKVGELRSTTGEQLREELLHLKDFIDL